MAADTEDDAVATLIRQKGFSPAKGRWAIALSGGGIRSATFSLGVLQAIAEKQVESSSPNKFQASLLARFDYLSTVSGGGYIGGFLTSLFVPQRLSASSEPTPKSDQGRADPAPGIGKSSSTAAALAAANTATEILCGGPPKRILREEDRGDERIYPMSWLRNNGRYLLPNGNGDFFYAYAVALRNWLSVHFVIGSALLPIFLGCVFYREWLVKWIGFDVGYTLFLPLAISAGVAYWLTHVKDKAKLHWLKNRGTASVLPLLLVLGCVLWLAPSHWGDLQKNFLRYCLAVLLAAIFIYMAAAARISNREEKAAVREIRVRLTRWLTHSLFALGIFFLLIVVDRCALRIFQHHLVGFAGLGLTLTGVVGICVKAFSLITPTMTFVKRFSIYALARILGLAAAFVLLVFWSLIARLLVAYFCLRNGELSLQYLGVLILILLLISLITGAYPDFINSSTHQPFYAGRLIRAYLGATNGIRHGSPEKSSRTVAEPMDGDDLELTDLAGSLAPFHIVNATVNLTSDPAQQLIQRDRKGLPLAVMRCGYSLDGAACRPFAATSGWTQIRGRLTLGQWLGISGAAITTGIGRETSLGMSLLMGIANVRLGSWWDSGAAKKEFGHCFPRSLWKTQRYLSYEFLARFFGLKREWQYVSDGGHFENLGIYELLRPERGVKWILACDNGADPAYQFHDLANLIRLARIDLNVEMAVETNFEDFPALASVFGALREFSPGPSSQGPIAVLLKAEHKPSGAVTWIVLIKPHCWPGASDDVWHYASKQRRFPQETTADQFFDEAQWESYRALGHSQCSRILADEVWRELAVRCGLQTATFTL